MKQVVLKLLPNTDSAALDTKLDAQNCFDLVQLGIKFNDALSKLPDITFSS